MIPGLVDATTFGPTMKTIRLISVRYDTGLRFLALSHCLAVGVAVAFA